MTDARQPPEIGLDEAYGVETPEDNRRLYAAWADSYEASFVADKRYVYHRHVADILAEHFAGRSGVVLDVGCGTGIVGVELRRRGVSQIDGIDISPEMLRQAAKKTDAMGRVYRRLIEADLTKPIADASGRYAGIISVGTFTHGHLGPEALSHALPLAAPGAVCAIGINSAHFADRGFERHLDELHRSGKIGRYRLIDTLIYEGAAGDHPDDVGRVAVFTIRRNDVGEPPDAVIHHR